MTESLMTNAPPEGYRPCVGLAGGPPRVGVAGRAPPRLPPVAHP